MAIFKCKMCGGALEIQDGSSVAVCSFCGTKQTLPKLDDQTRVNLYDRANHFRRNNDYDKAMSIYEQLLAADKTDAEAYWSILLCKYGIEYVEDPKTHKMMPTINRAQYTSIFADEDYKSALQYADGYQRDVYEAEAKEFDKIQKGILAISQKEDPFDIFICYKETDTYGRRTQDSVLAQDLYYQLQQEGFKVFFSRITLEDKLGVAYEPYIFAALNTSKIMVVIGTSKENLNAVWVKNEWSRFLALTKKDSSKVLIPAYRDMDPYDLPEEFSHLQAQDMSKLGFMQDLIRGIKKIIGATKVQPSVVVQNTSAQTTNTDPLIKRAFMFLEDGDWTSANRYSERVLDINPECSKAYFVKLLAELNLKKPESLSNHARDLVQYPNYQKALRFADEAEREQLDKYKNDVLANIKRARNERIYADALKRVSVSKIGEKELKQSILELKSISGYKDADDRAAFLEKRLETLRQRKREAEEKARIKAEEDRIRRERLAQERKILAAKRAKKIRIAALCMLGVVVLSVLVATVFVPVGEINHATTLINDGKFQEAIDVYDKWNTLYNNSDKAQVARSIGALYNADTKFKQEQRIDAILANVKEVKINYNCYNCDLEVSSAVEKETDDKGTWHIYNKLTDFNAGLPKPEREGYKFVSWKFKSHDVESNDCVRLIFEPVWDAISYEIEYILDGGINSSLNPSKYSADMAFALHAPTKTGYYFDGWTSAEYLTPEVAVVIHKGTIGKLTFTAKWSPINFTIHLDPNGGTVNKTTIGVDYDSNYQLPIPQRKGYEFVGWFNGTVAYSNTGIWNTAADITLTAKWKSNEYDITYVLGLDDVSNMNPSSYIYGNSVVLKEPTKDGYSFIGWTWEGQDVPTKEATISAGSLGSKCFEANWRANTYTITYDANGGDVSPATQEVVYDEEYSLAIPTRTGYDFAGWLYNSTPQVDGRWSVALNPTFVAQWTAREDIRYVVNHYQENAENNNYTLFETQNLEGVADSEVVPQRRTFAGFTAPMAKTVKVEPNGTLVVDYYYTRNTYTINFVSNGGDAIVSITQKHGSRLLLPNANRIGMTFGGWFDDVMLSSPTGMETMPIGGVTLYAWWTEESKVVDFEYEQDANGIVINGYVGESKSVRVPSFVGDTQVTVIKENAFENKTELIEVVLPDTILKIGERAFYGCNNLETITLPFVGASETANAYNAVFGYIFGMTTTYGSSYSDSYSIDFVNDTDPSTIQNAVWQYTCCDRYYAPYRYNSNAYHYYIPASIKNVIITHQENIPTAAFNGCYMIESITLPDSATSLGECAFQNTKLLSRVNSEINGTYNLPQGIHSIENNLFYGAEALENISLSNITEIGDSAFEGCVLLTDPTFGAITKIGKYAFKGCLSIKNIILPDTLTGDFDGCFYNCENMKSIIISRNITSICKNSFYGCSSLESITLPFVGAKAGVTSRDTYQYPFGYIFGTSSYTGGTPVTQYYYGSSTSSTTGTTYYVPSSLRSATVMGGDILYGAFEDCTMLTSITLLDDVTGIGENAFYNCSSMTSITVSNSVTQIGEYAFWNCIGLTDVVLPDSVKDIGSGAFAHCENLHSIKMDMVEIIRSNAFNYCKELSTINLTTSIKRFGAQVFTDGAKKLTIYYDGTADDWSHVDKLGGKLNNSWNYNMDIYVYFNDGSNSYQY